LIFGTSGEKESLIEDILVCERGEPPVVVSMVRNQFANYVVQKALAVANPRQKDKLIELLKASREELNGCQFFAHISNRYAGRASETLRTKMRSEATSLLLLRLFAHRCSLLWLTLFTNNRYMV